MDFENGKYTTTKHKLTKQHMFDAGLDICANEILTVLPRGRALISTGISLAIPSNCVGLLWSRSGLSSKNGIEVGAGCIDSTYRGEVKVLLYNHSDVPFDVKEGDRIAQLLTIPVVMGYYREVESLDNTARGSGGFGSTGIQ